MSTETPKTTHAGNVKPGPAKYLVTEPHDHEKLKHGDIVWVAEDCRFNNVLVRCSDHTIHRLVDRNDQYVHLLPVLEQE